MTAVRLADLLAGLSRFADLGFGLEVGTSLRSSVLAARLADAVDLPASQARAAFYTALLHHLGCVGYAHETARLLGDELAVNAAAARTDLASPRDMLTTFLPGLTAGRRPDQRARAALTLLLRGNAWGDEFTTTACEVGRDAARRLGLPDEVQVALLHVYDLWQGERRTGALRGDAIPVGARIARITGVAALFASIGGPETAVDAVRRRAGGMLDPDLTARFAAGATDWLADLDRADAREEALAAEPEPVARARDLRGVAEAFADLADLKSPYLVGHSRAVAALAAAAGRADGSTPAGSAEPADLEIAGLLHDVGRVAISNAVWDRAGPLHDDGWEQVRLHAYHSERILAGSSELARLAPLVGRHHERLDGSGYHRGCTGADLSPAARVLSCADAYRTWTEPRPHRPALTPGQAEERLLTAVRAGALDQDAAHAVLTAAGHAPAPMRRTTPAGLTEREVEVLGLLARGLSNAAIADRLVVSRRTAEHHVQHIYTKLGVSCRAAATLFAVEHGLVPEMGSPTDAPYPSPRRR